MPNDFARTMRAGRRKRLDRAFKTVKGMPRSTHGHFKTFVVLIAAQFAFRHHAPRPSLFCLVPPGGKMLQGDSRYGLVNGPWHVCRSRDRMLASTRGRRVDAVSIPKPLGGSSAAR